MERWSDRFHADLGTATLARRPATGARGSVGGGARFGRQRVAPRASSLRRGGLRPGLRRARSGPLSRRETDVGMA